MKPLAIDLFSGLGGWTEGLLAEGFRVVGFDIERHVYGEAKYPAQLVIQDVRTIHGKQFKDAALIVASPPCQEFSYMAMPWSKAKQKIRDYESGVRDVKQLTALFDACFRIQREASDAAGHHIPMVVENVRGAQRWVGRASWNFGSFYLWGDVPALMPIVKKAIKVPTMGAGWYHPSDPRHVPSLGFNTHADRMLREGEKNPGFRFNGSGKSFQSESVNRLQDEGVKMGRAPNGKHFTNPGEWDGIKQGGDLFNKASGNSISRRTSSKSSARKRAAAMIAKIPLVLSRHIAAVYKPEPIEAVGCVRVVAAPVDVTPVREFDTKGAPR